MYAVITLLGVAIGLVFPQLSYLKVRQCFWFYVICVLSGVFAAGIILWIVQKMVLSPLDEFLDAMEKASRGDLNVAIEGKYIGDFQALAQHFNLMLESLRSSVAQLKTSSEETLHLAEQLTQTIQQMHGATEEVSSTIQNISKGAEEQAVKVQEAFNIIDKMAGNIQVSAELLSNSEKVVSRSKNASAAGSAAVQKPPFR